MMQNFLFFVASSILILSFLPCTVSQELNEESCATIEGDWSPLTQSCFKLYESKQLRYFEAWAVCMHTALPGSRGRIPQFPSQSVFDQFKSYSGAWLGAFAQIPPAEQGFRQKEWIWVDRYQNGSEIRSPMTWHTEKVVVWDQARCMMIDEHECFNDVNCNDRQTTFCEYVRVSDFEMVCAEAGAYWSTITNSCYKLHESQSLTNANAWQFCMESAPCGSRGRLSQIPNELVFQPFKTYSGAWLSSWAPQTPAQQEFRSEDWVWLDKFANGTEVTTPIEWHTESVVVGEGTICMIIDDQGLFNDAQCDNKQIPFCEYVQLTIDREKSCADIDGHWSTETDSCFKLYESESMTNDDAWQFCMDSAPCGSRGRLPRIPSESVFDNFKTYEGAWLSAWAMQPPAKRGFRSYEWAWVDRFPDGLRWNSPITWHTEKVVVWQKARCMMIDANERFNDVYCDNEQVVFCEYVEKEPVYRRF